MFIILFDPLIFACNTWKRMAIMMNATRLSLLSLSPLSPITSLTLWLEDLAGAHVDAVYALYALRLYIRWTVASSPVAL